MAVALDHKKGPSVAGSFSQNGVTAVSDTFTVGSGANRALVALICFSGATVPANLSFKYDTGGANQSLSQIGGSIVNGNGTTDIAVAMGLVAPSSGTNLAFTVSWTGAREIQLVMISFTGVNQAGGATSFQLFTNSGTSSNPATVSVTSGANDGMCGVFLDDNTQGSCTVSDNALDAFVSGANFDSNSNYALGVGNHALTGTWGSACSWAALGVNVSAVGGAATPTFGWQSRREDERPRAILLAPDEGAFRWVPKSPNPVPTSWLPTTGADRERLPPLQRTDWAPTTFARSPSPVPTIWLPTTGQEDRPPAQKRPPDEDGNRFVRPSQIRVPTQWLPTAGEHDHIKPIARAPDEPPGPWFVRSPNPVPTTWLPTTGEEDRPPPIKLPPDEPRQFFRPPQAAAVGIAGMAWFRPVEVYVGPAPPQGDYRPAWAPQIITQQVVKLNLPIEVTPFGAFMNFGLTFRM